MQNKEPTRWWRQVQVDACTLRPVVTARRRHTHTKSIFIHFSPTWSSLKRLVPYTVNHLYLQTLRGRFIEMLANTRTHSDRCCFTSHQAEQARGSEVHVLQQCRPNREGEIKKKPYFQQKSKTRKRTGRHNVREHLPT